jgi:hypothetical protein
MVVNVWDIADRTATEKTFKFAEKYNLPFYFVSAADGTNVVKVKDYLRGFYIDDNKDL